MDPHSPSAVRSRGWLGIAALGLLTILAPAAGRLAADPPKSTPAAKKTATEVLPTGVITADMWRQAPTTPLQPDEIKANKSWAEIARAMITAGGEMRYDGKDMNGAVFFLGSRRGMDAAVERAAETSRVFLGIQIQCAQCHDHPSDVWKRQQFHEF